jgi:type III restriction enzyme
MGVGRVSERVGVRILPLRPFTIWPRGSAVPPVVIENPILNSPFAEPTRHFLFDNANNITAEIGAGRRPSCYFLPIASPKKKAKGLFDSLIADEKREETNHVNNIREKVKLWRDRGWPDVTAVTRSLLEH